MSARPWLGIDVGGTTIKVGVATADGRLVAQWAVPTPRGVAELADAVAAQVRHAELQEGPMAGVGVVVPGIVDEATGTAVFSVNLGWRDVPLRDVISHAVGRRVAFGHDVRAGALAEARWGAGAADMLYVPLGTGIAAGVVLGGCAVSSGGYGGEIGQVLVIDPSTGGPERLEAVASATAIARRYAERVRGDDAHATTPAPSHDVSRCAEDVVALVRAGDATAAQVFTEAVDALADVLGGSIGLLGPVRVVIGGGLVGAGDLLLDRLRDALAERLCVVPVPEIVVATLGSWSQALGAVALAIARAEDA